MCLCVEEKNENKKWFNSHLFIAEKDSTNMLLVVCRNNWSISFAERFTFLDSRRFEFRSPYKIKDGDVFLYIL